MVTAFVAAAATSFVALLPTTAAHCFGAPARVVEC